MLPVPRSSVLTISRKQFQLIFKILHFSNEMEDNNDGCIRLDCFWIICVMCSEQYTQQGRSWHAMRGCWYGVGVCLSGSVTQKKLPGTSLWFAWCMKVPLIVYVTYIYMMAKLVSLQNTVTALLA
jgi:hypothetical protein